MDEFADYKILDEGRIPLIKYQIKKNNHKWTLRDTSTNQISYLNIDQAFPEKSLHDFLSGVEAYSSHVDPKTKNGIIDYHSMVKDLFLNSGTTFYIKANKRAWIDKNFLERQRQRIMGAQPKKTSVDNKIHDEIDVMEDTVSGDIGRIGGGMGMQQRGQSNFLVDNPLDDGQHSFHKIVLPNGKIKYVKVPLDYEG